jgi:hypothetical protein
VVWWWLCGRWGPRAVAESKLSVEPIGHDAEAEGTWDGPSVPTRGEAVVAPGTFRF